MSLPLYSSYAMLKPQFHSKFGGNPWYNQLLGYLEFRYFPIERRVIDISRYVDIHSNNKTTFSYELGSILRDIGSTFSSVMSKLGEHTCQETKTEFNIADFILLLTNEIKDVELIGLNLTIPFKQSFILPFDGIKSNTPPRTKLSWWQPYNNIKHSDIDNFADGNLGNVIYGIATLATLFTLMDENHRLVLASNLFRQGIGYFKPIENIKQNLF